MTRERKWLELEVVSDNEMYLWFRGDRYRIHNYDVHNRWDESWIFRRNDRFAYSDGIDLTLKMHYAPIPPPPPPKPKRTWAKSMGLRRPK